MESSVPTDILDLIFQMVQRQLQRPESIELPQHNMLEDKPHHKYHRTTVISPEMIILSQLRLVCKIWKLVADNDLFRIFYFKLLSFDQSPPLHIANRNTSKFNFQYSERCLMKTILMNHYCSLIGQLHVSIDLSEYKSDDLEFSGLKFDEYINYVRD